VAGWEIVVDLGALCEWERRRKDEGKREEVKRESRCEGGEKVGMLGSLHVL
jgi:hypothetical protein